MDLHGFFGGWPNALQGLASTLLSGVVAALTALLIVRLTASRDRDLAQLQETRAHLLRVAVATTTVLVGIPDSRPMREDVETAYTLNAELRLAAALVASRDKDLGQTLQDRADQVAEVARGWERDHTIQSEDAAYRRFNQLHAATADVHELVINWLGGVNVVERPADVTAEARR